MGLLLTTVAVILLYILTIPAVLVGVVMSLFSHTGNKYFRDIALSLDQLGNVLCQHLFNLTLIKRGGYRFGNVDETISSVVGKNYIAGTLTKTGMVLASVLNRVDKNHVVKSIDYTV